MYGWIASSVKSTGVVGRFPGSGFGFGFVFCFVVVDLFLVDAHWSFVGRFQAVAGRFFLDDRFPGGGHFLVVDRGLVGVCSPVGVFVADVHLFCLCLFSSMRVSFCP